MAATHFDDLVLTQEQHANGSVVRCSMVKFTIASGTAAGTYTGSALLPAGARILDIALHTVAQFNAGTSASMEIGDYSVADVAIDADGFFTAVNVKDTDLTTAQGLHFAKTGGQEGAYADGSATHWNATYSATARKIVGKITTVGTAPTTGEVWMYVYWHPDTEFVTATYAAT